MHACSGEWDEGAVSVSMCEHVCACARSPRSAWSVVQLVLALNEALGRVERARVELEAGHARGRQPGRRELGRGVQRVLLHFLPDGTVLLPLGVVQPAARTRDTTPCTLHAVHPMPQ